MIKHALIGVFAAFVAIVIVAVAQPKEPPTVALGPPVVKIDDLESFIPKREMARRAPATRPANPLEKVLPEVNFNSTPFSEVIEFFRDRTGANYVVNWLALEAAGIERTTPVTVKLNDLPAAEVLSTVLRHVNAGGGPLAYRFHNGIVHVSTADYIAVFTDIRIYNVRDLMIEALRFHRSFDHAVTGGLPTTRPRPHGGFQPPITWTEEEISDTLRGLITQCADPDSWVDNGGRTGVCHYWASGVWTMRNLPAQ